MKQGPLIHNNQYAVLMVDGATGHVLTTKENLYLGDESEVYTICENIEEARIFIKEKQRRNDTLECVVYNSKYDFVERWEAIKWKK